jgi:acyl carrier protein
VVLVLRTARGVVAERRGIGLDLVRPETRLDAGAEAREVLDELHEKVIDLIAREEALDPRGARRGDRTPPTPEQLGLSIEDRVSVASIAELATRAAVRLLLAHRLDVPADQMRPELHFTNDLGADSLTRVDLVLLLEEALEVSVPDDSLSLVQSVGDAELFAVLFDRTREEIVLALGESAETLANDTPLVSVGDRDGQAAIAAAARAVGTDLPSCRCTCETLKDAVRLAYLAVKVRGVLARSCGVDPATIDGDTVPETDLGLDPDRTRQVLADLAETLEIDPKAATRSHRLTVAATVRAFADASIEASRG